MSARSRATKSYETKALVLRRTPYREADLVVTLFTAELGQVSALARAARKSQRRFGGSLEPFHTLEVELVPLPYDHRALAAEMREEGLPEEFVETILTGWWTTCLEILPARERAASRF